MSWLSLIPVEALWGAVAAIVGAAAWFLRGRQARREGQREAELQARRDQDRRRQDATDAERAAREALGGLDAAGKRDRVRDLQRRPGR